MNILLTSRTLNQIIDVLGYLRLYFLSGNELEKSYHKAVNRVSDDYNLSYQTIGDSCRRRLDLESIILFRNLARDWLENNSEKLHQLLLDKTRKSDHRKIEEFFSNPSDWESKIKRNREYEEFEEEKYIEIKISKKDLHHLKAISEIEKIGVNEFARIFIKNGIKSHLKKIAEDY